MDPENWLSEQAAKPMQKKYMGSSYHAHCMSLQYPLGRQICFAAGDRMARIMCDICIGTQSQF
jgi:hypothetical protein